MKISKKIALRAAGYLVTVASLVFVIRKFVAFDIDYRALLSRERAAALLGSVALFVAANMLAGVNWNDMLAYFSKKTVKLKDSFPVYSKSNLCKYLPGNIGHYVSRQVFGVSLGVGHRQLAISSILEVFDSAFSALLLSAALSWNKIFDVSRELFPNLNVGAGAAIVFISGAAVFALSRAVFREAKFFSDLAALAQDRRFWFLLARITLRNTVCFLVNGAMLTLFMRTSVPLDYSSVVVIVTASAVSWLAGFVTPGAPGGVGVREGVLLLMLSPHFPGEVVLASAALCRISMVLGDVLSFSLGLFVRHICRRPGTSR
jgi:hypothetical protein